MEKQKFKQEIDNWLQEVYEKCNEFGEILNKDYYPFQSSKESLQKGVDLLIIGANPHGENSFNQNKEIDGLFNCGSDGYNAFITYPKWNISVPVIEIFSTPNLRKVLENVVILNAVYFNTNEVKDLSHKTAVDFCIKKTKEFIDILSPKVILILGFDVPKWLKIPRNNEKNGAVFEDETKKNALVYQTHISNIPTYIIHHPSRNPRFNNNANLAKKREFFEEIFEK